MKLTVKGHDRYASAEQAMLGYFGLEPDGEAISEVEITGRHTSFITHITLDGREGNSRIDVRGECEKEYDYYIKTSFYEAAQPLLPTLPWGSLTGIRPAKLASMLLEMGENADEVLRDKYFVSDKRRSLALSCAAATLAAKNSLQQGDIALYIGIPFCPSRCAYCSFVSTDVEKSGKKLLTAYLDALLDEVRLLGETVKKLGLRIVTAYVGGGTPTTFDEAQIEALLRCIHEVFDLSALRELTMEAGRPDTITEEKLLVCKKYGVTRVSINPQTMENHVLEAIGRRHTAEETRNAYELAKRTGFKSINCDLIAGLPKDTVQGFVSSLQHIISWKPENITIHSLALKKGAKLMENRQEADASAVEKMLDEAAVMLKNQGYRPYYLYRQKFMAGGFENVGWCLEGHENLYNLCMMEELSTVLSAGAGGVSKLLTVGHGGDVRIDRVMNMKYPLEYLQSCDKIRKNIGIMETLLS